MTDQRLSVRSTNVTTGSAHRHLFEIESVRVGPWDETRHATASSSRPGQAGSSVEGFIHMLSKLKLLVTPKLRSLTNNDIFTRLAQP